MEALNNTFKIHRGGASNTFSAGCQTIHPERFDAFMDLAYANSRQQRWQYVLTDTTTGLFRDVRVEVQRDQAPQREAPVPGRHDVPDEERPPAQRPHGPQEHPRDRPQASRIPETAEDAYLERFFATSERGDLAARRSATREYGSQPQVQELDRQGRESLAFERAVEATNREATTSPAMTQGMQPALARGA